MEKNLFVAKFLKSAFKAADSNIVDITYQNGANGEFVYIYAKGQGKIAVCVTGDSNLLMIKDVVDKMLS